MTVVAVPEFYDLFSPRLLAVPPHAIMGTEKSLTRFNGRIDLVPFHKPHKRNFNQKDSRAALEKYSLNKLDDKTYLDPNTKKRRDVVWMNWIEYVAEIAI